eukprot:6016520-Lingulodinium_polyedra.AAC.1
MLSHRGGPGWGPLVGCLRQWCKTPARSRNERSRAPPPAPPRNEGGTQELLSVNREGWALRDW